MPRLRSSQVFVEGDMVVFGYGGFYERPKDWGLDICYFQKSEFSWWRSRKKLYKRLRKALRSEVRSQRLTEAFVPHFIRRLQKLVMHEWHYDRADLMFQSAKTSIPSLARYGEFNTFVRMVIPGRPFCTPQELEERVREYLMTINPGKDPLKDVESQTYLLFGFLLKAIEADMQKLLGVRQGEWLFKRLLDIAPEPPRSTANLDAFLQVLLLHPKAQKQIAQWHGRYFEPMLAQKKHIRKTLYKLQVARPHRAIAAKARRAVLHETRKSLPPELPALLNKLNVPLFVATGSNLDYFSAFHQPGYLVYRQTGTMHQMTGLGLCVHRDHARGGVFVTYNAAERQRFCHTLLEECTHFADGPQDRETLQGQARYSGTAEFAAALAADQAMHAPWQHNKALTGREWGMILTQMHYSAKRVARLQQRIEAYGATLDFRHYAEEEHAAEMFAALPVIEKAVGHRMARRILPNMFVYYDKHYRKGLRAEV